MKNKKIRLLLGIILTMILVFAVAVFASCGNTDVNTDDDKKNEQNDDNNGGGSVDNTDDGNKDDENKEEEKPVTYDSVRFEAEAAYMIGAATPGKTYVGKLNTKGADGVSFEIIASKDVTASLTISTSLAQVTAIDMKDLFTVTLGEETLSLNAQLTVEKAGWESFATVTVGEIALKEGSNMLKFMLANGEKDNRTNFDYIELTPKSEVSLSLVSSKTFNATEGELFGTAVVNAKGYVGHLNAMGTDGVKFSVTSSKAVTASLSVTFSMPKLFSIALKDMFTVSVNDKAVATELTFDNNKQVGWEVFVTAKFADVQLGEGLNTISVARTVLKADTAVTWTPATAAYNTANSTNLKSITLAATDCALAWYEAPAAEA